MATGHLASLSAKHAQLDNALSQEAQRPFPDTIRLAALKKQKLRLKDEMSVAH